MWQYMRPRKKNKTRSQTKNPSRVVMPTKKIQGSGEWAVTTIATNITLSFFFSNDMTVDISED